MLHCVNILLTTFLSCLCTKIKVAKSCQYPTMHCSKRKVSPNKSYDAHDDAPLSSSEEIYIPPSETGSICE